MAELVTVNPIEYNSNASRLPEQSTPMPKDEILSSKSESMFSPCPAKSIPSQDPSLLPKLQFVHIRKTGGTAVITSFLEAGLEPYKINYSVRLNRTALQAKRKPGNREHIPPRYWRNRTKLGNLHFFAIVRNPYERAISEYYQHFKSGFHKPPPNISVNDASFLNKFVQSYYRRAGGDLFIPQYEYIFDAQGNRIVHHILHFESTTKEFPELMACYGLNISLPKRPVNQRQAGASLTVGDLTPKSIALINEVERISFETFGFEMINSTTHFLNSTDS